MPKIKLRLLGVTCLASLFSSCWEEPEVIADTTVPPAKIAGFSLPDNTELTTDTCAVSWSATGAFTGFEYQFNNGGWSSLFVASTIDTLLSDGAYTLSVRSKNGELYTDTLSVPFTVNALGATAGYLSPRYQTVSTVGSSVVMQLFAKSAVAFSGFTSVIQNLTIDSVKASTAFASGLVVVDRNRVEGIAQPSTILSGTVALCTIYGKVTGTPDAQSQIPVTLSSMALTSVDKSGAETTAPLAKLQAGIVSLLPSVKGVTK